MTPRLRNRNWTVNIGLFGGSFNPPHVGHQIIAEWIAEHAGLARVWWIPAAIPPHHTRKPLETGEHRLAMTRLAVRSNQRFDISTVELKRKGRSYTVDTVRELTARHPEHTFSLIIGGDSLTSFPSWKQPETIIDMVPLLVYPRPEAGPPDLTDAMQTRVAIVDAPLIGISSSEIRKKLYAGLSVRYLMPEEVIRYIDSHRLYRSGF